MGDLDYETGANYDMAAAAQVIERCASLARVPSVTSPDEQLIKLVQLNLEELCDEVLSRERSIDRSLMILSRLLENAWELYRREWGMAVGRDA